jgi:hypothetical protein
MNEAIFLRRENMLADGEVVVVAVDELEGEHELTIILNQLSS